MKYLCVLISVCVLLSGCSQSNDSLQAGINLREKLMTQNCSFTADITADFGDKTYTFTMRCNCDTDGTLSFIVLSPESISGIAGKLTGASGYLTFDDTALAFPLLADGELSPVSAPWLLINTLRSGYLASAGEDGVLQHLTLHESYEADALQVDVWLDGNEVPQHGEFLWQNRRVLSIHIKDFNFL